MRFFFVIVWGVLSVVFSGFAQAEIPESPWANEVRVCPAKMTDTAPPDFSMPSCTTLSLLSVDPQGQHLWVKVPTSLPPDVQPDDPVSLFVSVKGSSLVYLNGQKVGENGYPSDDKLTEVPGKMDASFTVPPALLKSGINEIVLRVSSHHGYLHLVAPVHLIGIDKFQNSQDFLLRNYWPTLLPFGALILGGLYFLIMALRGRQSWPAGLLSLMSIAAAAQLFIEVSRGLYAYPYPVQDLRLIGIWTCAAIFGVSLCAYIIERFQTRLKTVFGILAIILALFTLSIDGMDTKASLAFLLPTALAIGLCLYHGLKDSRSAWGFGAVLSLFALINVFTSGQFLDVYFYYIVLALLLFLFAQQAAAFAREQELLIQEAERSERLQTALDRKGDAVKAVTLNVTSAGTIRHINAQEITHINGAGDYSDIVLATGKTYLHSQTLSELEKILPRQFLRVHRSHIVNTDFIETLTREPSGSGNLLLNTGSVVPVSRRIMPGVRQALT